MHDESYDIHKPSSWMDALSLEKPILLGLDAQGLSRKVTLKSGMADWGATSVQTVHAVT